MPTPSPSKGRRVSARKEIVVPDKNALTIEELGSMKYVSPYSGEEYHLGDGLRNVSTNPQVDEMFAHQVFRPRVVKAGQINHLYRSLTDNSNAKVEVVGDVPATTDEELAKCEYDPADPKFRTTATYEVAVGQPTIGEARWYYSGRKGKPQPAGTFTSPTSPYYQGPSAARAARVQYHAAIEHGHHDGLATPGAADEAEDSIPAVHVTAPRTFPVKATASAASAAPQANVVVQKGYASREAPVHHHSFKTTTTTRTVAPPKSFHHATFPLQTSHLLAPATAIAFDHVDHAPGLLHPVHHDFGASAFPPVYSSALQTAPTISSGVHLPPATFDFQQSPAPIAFASPSATAAPLFSGISQPFATATTPFPMSSYSGPTIGMGGFARSGTVVSTSSAFGRPTPPLPAGVFF